MLSIYTERLCDEVIRALADRTSMLWRLRLHGLVGPGEDPSEIALEDLPASRAGSIPMAFVGAHVALGFAACDDADPLRRLAETAAVSGTPGSTTLVEPLATALADRIDGDYAASADRPLSIEHQLPLLGGSHAQREIFEDTLIETLIRAGRTEEASRRLHARLQRRPSPLDQAWMTR